MDQELVTYLDRRFSDLDGRFSDLDDRFSHELGELRRDTGAQIRHVHVLVEGLRDDIRAVAEGVDANHEAHRELRRELDLRFEDVRTWCGAPWAELDRRTRDNSLRIGGLENRVTGLEDR